MQPPTHAIARYRREFSPSRNTLAGIAPWLEQEIGLALGDKQVTDATGLPIWSWFDRFHQKLNATTSPQFYSPVRWSPPVVEDWFQLRELAPGAIAISVTSLSEFDQFVFGARADLPLKLFSAGVLPILELDLANVERRSLPSWNWYSPFPRAQNFSVLPYEQMSWGLPWRSPF